MVDAPAMKDPSVYTFPSIPAIPATKRSSPPMVKPVFERVSVVEVDDPMIVFAETVSCWVGLVVPIPMLPLNPNVSVEKSPQIKGEPVLELSI